MGSIFVARRAGNQHASTTTKIKTHGTITNTTGSLPLNPTTKLTKTLRSNNASITPIADPMIESLIPCPRISRSTSPACAPSAMRTPISFVR